MHLKMSSAKWREICLAPNVLNQFGHKCLAGTLRQAVNGHTGTEVKMAYIL